MKKPYLKVIATIFLGLTIAACKTGHEYGRREKEQEYISETAQRRVYIKEIFAREKAVEDKERELTRRYNTLIFAETALAKRLEEKYKEGKVIGREEAKKSFENRERANRLLDKLKPLTTKQSD